MNVIHGFKKKHDNVTYVLMEIRQETDYVKRHVQKVVFFCSNASVFPHLDWIDHYNVMVDIRTLKF